MENTVYKEKYFHDDLINLSEEVVFEQIDKIIEAGDFDLPQNDMVIQDVAAIALNNMPAKYICNLFEKQNPRRRLQDEVKDLQQYARHQVVKAITRVKNARHDI